MEFFFQFPVWVIAKRTGSAADVLKGAGDRGEIATPLFTEIEHAKEMLAGFPQPTAFEPIEVGTQLQLLGLLAVFESQGVAYVTLDPRRNAPAVTTAELRTSLLAAIEKQRSLWAHG